MKYSIIITTSGHCEEYLKPCLKSIEENSDMQETEIIVVANGCKDNTKEYLATKTAKTLWFDNLIGYTKACNEGMKVASGDYIVLLNDDTVVLLPTWLNILEQPFIDNPKAGMTGPLKFTWDCGGVTRTSIAFWCVMFRRALIDELGPLDETFNPGMGEDGDYSIKAEFAGYELVQVPVNVAKAFGEGVSDSSFPIFHKGNGTFGEVTEEKNNIIKRNNDILAYKYGKKHISFIIPTYNHLEDLLKPCIESLIKYTDLENCEVLISANGCTDGTREYVQSLGAPFKLIWNKEAVGFPKAINDAIKFSAGEYLILLNNDVELLEQNKGVWMDMMLTPFHDPAVGITGPLMELSPAANMHSFVVFFCAAIRREVIDKIGMLDEVFGVGGGEDTDFCIRAERAGYKIIQVPGDTLVKAEIYGGVFPIYHKAEKTMHDPECITGWKDIFEQNSAILHERYGKTVKISIVIPTYNHLEDALKPCLEAVLKYTDLTDKEVIVVPNGCNDGTAEYLQSLGSKVRVISFDKPMGYIVPVNTGAKAAIGEYIVLLSNDCILMDQSIDQWINTMLAPFLVDSNVGLTGPFVYDYLGLGRVVHGGCAMYKKEVWDKINGYDPIFTYGYISDVDISLRITAAGYKAVGVPEDEYRDRVNGTFLIHFPIYTTAGVTSMDRHADAQLVGKNRALTSKRHKVQPLVSIIVPTCNREADLKTCLEGIFEYTDCLDKEIIVVANGCTDGTLEYLDSLKDCLTVVVNDEPVGHVISANAGVAVAKGQFVVLLDDDSHLQSQEVDAWITLLKLPFAEDVSVGMSGVFVADYPYLGRAIHSGCSMYRKDVWDQVGGGDLAFGFGYLYDTDLSLRIQETGYKIVPVGENGSFPLFHPGSPINTESKLKSVSLIRKNREILYRRHGMKPKYSIIVPTYNHLEDCLKPCLSSIVQQTDLEDVEVIVVANGCKDKTAEYVDSLGYPFKLVWFDEGLGFTKATNEGIKVAQGDYVVLLNNDTVLLDKGQPKNTWLNMLVMPFLVDQYVGISGPLMLYDTYAGADVMIFFCVMIRHDMFDKVGLLDESYSPGGGEDIDFCVKLVKAGYKQAVVPDVNVRVDAVEDGKSSHTNVGGFPIYHAGEATFSKEEWPEYGTKIIKDNGMKNMIRYNKHIKLNLGSGGVEIPGYISVDKNDLRAHILLDVFELDKHLPENSVEEIIASHLFEHVNPYKSVDLLKSWRKILKPGGKLIMEMPNIEEQCKDFVTASKDERYGILNVIYGAVNTTSEGKPSDITSPHLWGWYPEMMYDHLVWAGYTDIKIGPEQIPHPHKNFRVEASNPSIFRDAIDKFVYENVAPGESVLDLGCGDKQRTKILTQDNKVVSVDVWDKAQPDIVLDLEIAPLPFEDNSFDVVLMIDFIEHLDKEAGQKIMEEAKRVCKKKVILFTPAFWTDNKENIENPELWSYQNKYDLHKSFWSVEDFPGWKAHQYQDQRFLLRVWENNEVLDNTTVLQTA